MELKFNPMVQALEYIEKNSGKSSFVFCSKYGDATIASFSKKSIQEFIKENKYLFGKKSFNEDESGVLVGKIDNDTYVIILFAHQFDEKYIPQTIKFSEFSFLSPNTDKFFVILATSDLAKDQDFIIHVNGDEYRKEAMYALGEWRWAKELIAFNGFGKKDVLLNKVKTFNDRRYGTPVSTPKKQEQFKNIPMAYRGRKTATPKKNTSGIRLLENSVRRMF